MGASDKGSKVRWLPMVIYMGAFLRYLLSGFGYALDEGLVIVADDMMQARRFVAEYCQKAECNGVRIEGWKKRGIYPLNYGCGLMLLKNTMKEEEVMDFLSEQKFLPIVVSGGILPEYLRYGRYIFRLREDDLEYVSDKRFMEAMTIFRNYVVQDVTEVCTTIDNLATSLAITEYRGSNQLKKIYSFLAGIGAVCTLCLRKYLTERDVQILANGYIKETNKRLQQFEEFASGEELWEMFSSLVWAYAETQTDLQLSDCREIFGDVYLALKEQQAIVFDDKYYYFPTKLFIKICAPLLETSSEPELKRRLKEEGILHCNSNDYTVKKEIITVYGAKERIRMLWVHKECLLSEENLWLEDVYGSRAKAEADGKEV